MKIKSRTTILMLALVVATTLIVPTSLAKPVMNPPSFFIATGGGNINSTVMPNVSTFGFQALNISGKLMGNLQYNDHGANIKLHGNVTMLSVNKTAGTAMFTGLATVTNATGVKMMLPYTVNVTKGNKGVGIFNITVTTAPVYTDEGKLLGGSINIW